MKEFKNEHIVLDLDNKEAHYNQIVKIIEAEGRSLWTTTISAIKDAIIVNLDVGGDYWLSKYENDNPERHIPFVPEVKKFKDEYIMLDLDNKEEHHEQVVKVLKSEGKNFYFGGTCSYKATHIRCFSDGTFCHYYDVIQADGEERKIPYIPIPERLTLTDNILTVDGKTRYTLTEIEEVEEEKEFTISQVFSAVSHFSNGGAWKHDVRDFFNNLGS